MDRPPASSQIVYYQGEPVKVVYDTVGSRFITVEFSTGLRLAVKRDDVVQSTNG